jgi:hypothetical protein
VGRGGGGLGCNVVVVGGVVGVVAGVEVVEAWLGSLLLDFRLWMFLNWNGRMSSIACCVWS